MLITLPWVDEGQLSDKKAVATISAICWPP
jgi:hypothetical protein